MAGKTNSTVRELINTSKDNRGGRTKKVSREIEIEKGGKKKSITFRGTERTSKGGRKTVTKLSAPGVGTIKTKKKTLKGGRGTTVKTKKRAVKAL